MHIGPLVVVFALIASAWAPRAFAHGPAASATALLAVADGDATLVRVAGGLARRVPEGFRFVCPEAWDGDVIAPAAAIPGGPVLIASAQLYVLNADGRVSAHAEDVGAGIALASNDEALFGLFARAGKRELRRLAADGSELLQVFEQPFAALAVGSGDAWLLGWSKNVLFLQRVALSGEPRERVEWGILSAVARAELHVLNGQPYVTTWGSSAPWVTLGRVDKGAFFQLREARSSIGGPVAIDEGAWAVIDGALEPLEAEPQIGMDQDLTCLERSGAVSYVCVSGGLKQVDAHGEAQPLFNMDELREPDYRALSNPQAREDCSTRWLDLKVHLSGMSAPDAGATPAGEKRALEGAGGDDAQDSASCALATGNRRTGWLGALALVMLTARRRRKASARR